jgi:hypothetical protein
MHHSRLFALLGASLCSFGLLGQPAGAIFKKAPPEVDSALRGRIQQFIELQQQKKYRQAEALVCEESKDEYYGSEKKPLEKWELSEIVYEDGHNKATAVIVFDSVMTTVAGLVETKRPWATRWKIENGAWCIYFPDPLIEGRKTPFGFIKADERRDVSDPSQLLAKRLKTEGLEKPVTVSKRLIELVSSAKSSDEIGVSNFLPGPVTIEIEGPSMPGLTWQVTPPQIPTNSKGTIKFDYEPPNNFPKSDTQLMLTVQPLGLKIPVTVVFRTPGGDEPASAARQ